MFNMFNNLIARRGKHGRPRNAKKFSSARNARRAIKKLKTKEAE